jgi:hypothetical protein
VPLLLRLRTVGCPLILLHLLLLLLLQDKLESERENLLVYGRSVHEVRPPRC